MTTEQWITAQLDRIASHGVEYVAYYAGRNDAANGYKPDAISNSVVRESYKRGFRSMRSEMRLDADVEWDE